jgi:hypothetical protein
VVGQAEAGAVAPPVVPKPNEGLLVARDAADLAAASLVCRWERGCARLHLGHEGHLLVVKALRVFACRRTRGAVSLSDIYIVPHLCLKYNPYE